VLGRMGLAESTGLNTWRVRRISNRSFGQCSELLTVEDARGARSRRIRRAPARRSTRSDEYDFRRGPGPGSRQDEQTGRNYLMLEGTDAKVHFIHYTPEMEEARSRGELRTNSFVRLRKLPVDRALMLDVIDLGDAEMLLNDPRHLGETARQLLKRGVMPTRTAGAVGWDDTNLLCARPLGRSRSATSGIGFGSRSGAGIVRADDNRSRSFIRHRDRSGPDGLCYWHLVQKHMLRCDRPAKIQGSLRCGEILEAMARGICGNVGELQQPTYRFLWATLSLTASTTASRYSG